MVNLETHLGCIRDNEHAFALPAESQRLRHRRFSWSSRGGYTGAAIQHGTRHWGGSGQNGPAIRRDTYVTRSGVGTVIRFTADRFLGACVASGRQALGVCPVWSGVAPGLLLRSRLDRAEQGRAEGCGPAGR